MSEVLGMIQFHVPGVPIPQGSKKSIPHKDTAQQRATEMSGVGRRIGVSQHATVPAGASTPEPGPGPIRYDRKERGSMVPNFPPSQPLIGGA